MSDVEIEFEDEEEFFEWEDEEPELIEDGPWYGKTVAIKGYKGVAFRVDGHRMGFLEMHMVGDDRTFQFDVEDIDYVLDDEDFCSGCGQIGCGW